MGKLFTKQSADRIARVVQRVETMATPNNELRRRNRAGATTQKRHYQGMFALSFDTRTLPAICNIAAGAFVSGSYQATIAADTVDILSTGNTYIIQRNYYTTSLQTEYITAASFDAHDTVTDGGSTYYRYNVLIAQLVFDTGSNLSDWYQYQTGPIRTAGVFTIS